MYILGGFFLMAWGLCAYQASKKLKKGSLIFGALLMAVSYAGLSYFVYPNSLDGAMSLATWVALLVLSFLLGIAITHDEFRNLRRRMGGV